MLNLVLSLCNIISHILRFSKLERVRPSGAEMTVFPSPPTTLHHCCNFSPTCTLQVEAVG